jgi:predicted metal-dependent enzyme (double-stranded beta helix superfamily)
MPSRSRASGHVPQYLDPLQLLDYTRAVAAEVTAGRYPFIRYEQPERWHQRLYRDGRVDVWLIGWSPSQATQLHDHGGSAGALTVISGRLSELIHRPGGAGRDRLSEVVRTAGDSVGFGPHYVHDVRNLSDVPAASVHAYSPPLTRMSLYELGDNGRLHRLRSIDTDSPEPEPARDRPVAGSAA